MPALHGDLPSRRDGAGVRKPLGKETASRKGALSAAVSYGDLSIAGVCWRVVAVTIKDDLEGWSVASECSLLAMG